jgi:hypothetical protein
MKSLRTILLALAVLGVLAVLAASIAAAAPTAHSGRLSVNPAVVSATSAPHATGLGFENSVPGTEFGTVKSQVPPGTQYVTHDVPCPDGPCDP